MLQTFRLLSAVAEMTRPYVEERSIRVQYAAKVRLAANGQLSVESMSFLLHSTATWLDKVLSGLARILTWSHRQTTRVYSASN